MRPRRWTAFLRLKGRTFVENDRDIMREFTGFARQLEEIGLDYSIVVSVDGGVVEELGSRTGEIARKVQNSSRHGEEVSSRRA